VGVPRASLGEVWGEVTGEKFRVGGFPRGGCGIPGGWGVQWGCWGPPAPPPKCRPLPRRLCAGCQSLFPGVSLPPQRRCRWLCPDCRAQRRDFNREQRFYKRVGCGSCQACRIPEDCGICSACARNPPGGPSGPGPTPKCLLRRCLRIVKKGLGCGSCAGCLSTEDCGSCCICLRRLQPGLKRQWRCLRRRCLRPKKARAAKKTQSPRPLTEKWKPPVEREPSDASSTRQRDKEEPLGGAEQGPGPLPGPPLRLCPVKEEVGPLPRLEVRPSGRLGPPLDTWGPPLTPPAPQDPRLGLLIASAPRLKGAPPEPSAAPERVSGTPAPLEPPQGAWDPPVTPLPPLFQPPPGDLGVLIAATPRVKQEQPQPSASLVPVPPRPPPAPLVVLDESEEEEEEEEEGGSRVPLPLPPAPQLWPGSFLEELAEIPLPAHWGVVGGDGGGPGPCPARGLRLVQRCPRSPMAAAAVLLNPGLAFRVLVARGRPVPPGHEVLARRPPLRSVLDLVELLCDLEAYGPCPGPPGPPARPPAPRCHVLVRGGRSCRPCLMLAGVGH
uniref:Methyl-CpG binding domain protein 1 n=1 Tax=Corvus moneduloides TaxID=1196302 RepID=A0A8U7NUQ6_CORMO